MIGTLSDRERHHFAPTGYLELGVGPGQTAQIPASDIPGGQVLAVIHYAGGPFRFRVDGADPSLTNGWPAEDGDTDDCNRFEAMNWRACLAQGATSGTIRVGLYRRVD